MAVWAAGAHVGPYVLVSPLGAGGMGEVWKARDDRLSRTVAIKRVTHHDAVRFGQEARAIAALNHPNICQIYDVGPDYLVMEYIEGAPLRGPVPAEEAVRLALQIASALEEAHGQHILHRDLKPGNILVTPKATAKLLDFGLARVMTGGEETRSIASSGTPLYMSPEQVENQPLDARSDIFSFGAVLYELLSGRRAFDSVAAVLRDTPAPLDGPVAGIVMRCLMKEASARFETMTEVKGALQRFAATTAAEEPSIAVLPFANLSGDKEQEYFSDGLAEEIINLLAHVPGLKVTARTSAFAFRGKEQDITKIAETLRVRTILEGSVRRAGNRIRVTAQLINAADGYHLWSERFDRELADVFAVQDEIAAAIAGVLRDRLSAEFRAPRRYGPHLPAYEAYLRGRYSQWHLTPESMERARESYERAIALDPDFSLARVGLADYLLLLCGATMMPAHEGMPRVRVEAQHALALDPALQEAQAMLGIVAGVYDLDWPAAEQHFRHALDRKPIPPIVRVWHAFFLLIPTGRSVQAAAQAARAIEDDPLNPLCHAVHAMCLSASGRWLEAEEERQTVLRLDPGFLVVDSYIAGNSLARGESEEEFARAEHQYGAIPWHPANAGYFAGMLARHGDVARAAEVLRPIESGRLYGQPFGLAAFHVINGNHDKAADWLEKAIDQREFGAMTSMWCPLFEPVRASSRWPALMTRLNLPAPQAP